MTSVALSHAGGTFDGSVWDTADAITAMLGPVGRALGGDLPGRPL